MVERQVIHAPRLFDGEAWHEHAAIVLNGGVIEAIVPGSPAHAAQAVFDDGFLAPGFIDLQVNGGGGVLFNDALDLDGIRAITAAHARRGTTSLLVTLISDTPQATAKAVLAAARAQRAEVPGFLGLHIEGPHLAASRKGAHSGDLLRAMQDTDLALYRDARKTLDVVMLTLAPEIVPAECIAALRDLGIHVSLGHSDAGFAVASAAIAAGASMVTHLFNAMSPLGHREPGMVGAALRSGAVSAGLIADGHHVAAEAIAIAVAAKEKPGRIFLVSDAMPSLGSDIASFALNGRTIHRRDGCLMLADGTLAGADIDMADAVRFMHFQVGLDLGEALRMASLYPAMALDRHNERGRLAPGMRADLVRFDNEMHVDRVWIAGRLVEKSRDDG